MRSSVRTKFTRFLAVPAFAAAGVVLATAPAHAGPVSIAAKGATVADAGRTLNVTVAFQCSASSPTANIIVTATQPAASGKQTIQVNCGGSQRTATVPVTTAPAGQAWDRAAVDLSLYIVDEHIDRYRTTARVVAQ
ncbi:hypothetical protein ABTX81_26050 [Kitasatospora sp. NPDC097605]|uniref:hypothetical protein n=1 Tax=Kitasatospora sp. NPDC097605 TaxID=3157226 RepID=UPI00332ED9CB